MTSNDAPTFGTTEPVAITATIQAVALAVIGLGTAFHWWTWSDTQTGSILLILSTVATAFGGYVRAAVTPNPHVALTTADVKLINTAVQAPPVPVVPAANPIEGI